LEILQRTLLLKVGNMTGTEFMIGHQGALYLVTARHVAVSLAAEKWNSLPDIVAHLKKSSTNRAPLRLSVAEELYIGRTHGPHPFSG